MIKNTILVVSAAYVGTMLPEIATWMVLLAALSVGILSTAFQRTSQASAS